MKQIAIFASGEGSNAENIILYFAGHPYGRISMVISNRKTAPVLEKANSHGIPSYHFPKAEFESGDKILRLLTENKTDFIVLAGFLLLIPALILEKYTGRIINIHPALLPKYGGKGMYGMKVHEAVYANHEKESGITIHYVNEKFDEGEIIFQEKTPVSPADTPDMIQNKIRQLELKWYPKIIENILARGIN